VGDRIVDWWKDCTALPTVASALYGLEIDMCVLRNLEHGQYPSSSGCTSLSFRPRWKYIITSTLAEGLGT
jgi:hypothetical protein